MHHARRPRCRAAIRGSGARKLVRYAYALAAAGRRPSRPGRAGGRIGTCGADPAMPDDLTALLAFLGRGEAYGLPGREVEQVTTHAAIIFLVGERAYKMKRPVRYSF